MNDGQTKGGKGKKDAAEKRRDIRVHLKARVDYELLSEDTFLFEYTSNVSRGGIFLATRNPLPVGTVIRMHFSLPTNNRKIEVKGKVAWINEFKPGKKNRNPGMGVEFVNLTEEDMTAITQLIKRKALLADE
ncbi:MAG TPA: TIGR02266 family protein [bacterium]|nr:TIGR02266 family protein [bacterium]